MLTGNLGFQVDVDLAKQNADKPEDDEELRKKLWLRIGECACGYAEFLIYGNTHSEIYISCNEFISGESLYWTNPYHIGFRY